MVGDERQHVVSTVEAEPVLYTDRFYADAALHRPKRPEWTCQQCEQNWPCVNARLLIKRHQRDEYPAVEAAMTALLRLADADIDLCDRLKLCQDFTAWTRRFEVCGICGSSQHVARPGVPPRLIQCDALVAWMSEHREKARAVGES
jgi:hypothetical protein